MERAREYDRISEILASRRSPGRAMNNNDDGSVAFGVEARKVQFDKNSYRQPVLTEKPMLPKPYRRGQVDELADDCRARLQEQQDYSLMDGLHSDSGSSEFEKSQQ